MKIHIQYMWRNKMAPFIPVCWNISLHELYSNIWVRNPCFIAVKLISTRTYQTAKWKSFAELPLIYFFEQTNSRISGSGKTYSFWTLHRSVHLWFQSVTCYWNRCSHMPGWRRHGRLIWERVVLYITAVMMMMIVIIPFYVSLRYSWTAEWTITNNNIFFSWRDSPQWARASSLSRLHDYTQINHAR